MHKVIIIIIIIIIIIWAFIMRLASGSRRFTIATTMHDTMFNRDQKLTTKLTHSGKVKIT